MLEISPWEGKILLIISEKFNNNIKERIIWLVDQIIKKQYQIYKINQLILQNKKWLENVAIIDYQLQRK